MSNSAWKSQGWISGYGASKKMRSTYSQPQSIPESRPVTFVSTFSPDEDGYRLETRTRMVTQYRNETYYTRKCIGGVCRMVAHTRTIPFQVQQTYQVRVPNTKSSSEPAPKKSGVPNDISNMPDGTPQLAVDAILAVMGLDEGDTLWDIGSGRDARFLVTAAKRYGCRGVGIEINASHAESSRRVVADEGLSDRITIITADALEQTFGAAKKVVMYQYGDVQDAVIERLGRGTLVATYIHPPEGMDAKKFRVNGEEFFVGVKQK
ncbi:MAG: class I SAM-dependent methyltransferase [Planctomycetota bacterium]